jgi:hypothetical protein
MRTSISLLLLSVFPLFLAAQEDVKDRSFILGGSLSLSSSQTSFVDRPSGITNPSEDNLTSFAISPYFAKEVNSSVFIGLGLQYLNSNFRQLRTVSSFPTPINSDAQTRVNSYSVGLFGRYNFTPENRFTPFLQPGIWYVLETRNVDDQVFGDNLGTSNGIAFTTQAGIAYDFSARFRGLIRFGRLEVSSSKTTYENDDSEFRETNIIASLSPSTLSFGVEFRL